MGLTRIFLLICLLSIQVMPILGKPMLLGNQDKLNNNRHLSEMGSCYGKCNDTSMQLGGCYCDSNCIDNGNCCPDFEIDCGSLAYGSCRDETAGCDTYDERIGAKGSCYCIGCIERGLPCCPDFNLHCVQGSCKNRCGSDDNSRSWAGGGGCACDISCMYSSVLEWITPCCDDFLDICGIQDDHYGKCANIGCNNNTIQDGGCYCDSTCNELHRCCPDYYRTCLPPTNSPVIYTKFCENDVCEPIIFEYNPIYWDYYDTDLYYYTLRATYQTYGISFQDTFPCYNMYTGINTRFNEFYEDDILKWRNYYSMTLYFWRSDNTPNDDAFNIFNNNKDNCDALGSIITWSMNIISNCLTAVYDPTVYFNRYVWVNPKSFRKRSPSDNVMLMDDSVDLGSPATNTMSGVVSFEIVVYGARDVDLLPFRNLLSIINTLMGYNNDTQIDSNKEWIRESVKINSTINSIDKNVQERWGLTDIHVFFSDGKTLNEDPNPLPKANEINIWEEYGETIILSFIMACCIIVGFTGFIHAKGACKCFDFICGCRPADDVQWIAVALYLIQIIMIYSDISLINNKYYVEWKKPQNMDTSGLLIVIFSSIFIGISYIANIISSCFINNKIEYHSRAMTWFLNNSYIFIVFVVLSGSYVKALEFVSSKLYGMKIFSSGLTKMDLFSFRKYKFFYGVLLGTLPQFFIKIAYTIKYGGSTLGDALVLTAFAANIMSLMSSALTFCLSSQFDVERVFTKMDIIFNEKTKDEDLKTLKTKKMHKRKAIGEALAPILGFEIHCITVTNISITSNGCCIEFSILRENNEDIHKILDDTINSVSLGFKYKIKQCLGLIGQPKTISHNKNDVRLLSVQVTNTINKTNDETMMKDTINNSNNDLEGNLEDNNGTTNQTETIVNETKDDTNTDDTNIEMKSTKEDNEFKILLNSNGFNDKIYQILLDNEITSVNDIQILKELTDDEWNEMSDIKIITRKKLLKLVDKLSMQNQEGQ